MDIETTSLSVDDVLSIEYPDAPSWSADGTFLASTVYADDGKVLHVASLDDEDGSVRVEEPWRFEPDGAYVTDFEWAPEGRPTTMVVTTDDEEVLLLDAADRSVERLARTPGGDGNVTCRRTGTGSRSTAADVPGYAARRAARSAGSTSPSAVRTSTTSG